MSDHMTCVEVREEIAAFAREGNSSLAVRRHLSRCPECRVELARYQALVESLAAMRTVAAEPPAGLVAGLEAIPSSLGRVDSLRTHVTRNRGTYVGGVAVLAAGVAGAALWRVRSRRVATA